MKFFTIELSLIASMIAFKTVKVLSYNEMRNMNFKNSVVYLNGDK